jgi:UDP-glucose 4-epimerase
VFIEADLVDSDKLDELFSKYSISAVMHLAASSIVSESMREPKNYFLSNVICGIHLLNTALKYGVDKVVFSSSAAIYGSPERMPIHEKQAVVPPVNTYGETKLMMERILKRYDQAYGIKFISLRYFNASGASDKLGEDHNPETHLIPTVLKCALGQSEHVAVFGKDYPTSDGTCIRDYIHVSDIAKAHILALNRLVSSNTSRIYNLGTFKGYSVLEVINAARQVTGVDIPVVFNERRPGDPPVLIASSELAESELGWKPQYNQIADIVSTAWQWQKAHPNGYASRRKVDMVRVRNED